MATSFGRLVIIGRALPESSAHVAAEPAPSPQPPHDAEGWAALVRAV